jgi:hypothetical protein
MAAMARWQKLLANESVIRLRVYSPKKGYPSPLEKYQGTARPHKKY